MSASVPSGLLLVECVPPDPWTHYRAEHFPYLQGMAARVGIPTQWFALASGADGGDRFFFSPTDGQRALISAAITGEGVTHVVFDESLCPEFAAFLADEFPSVVVACIGDLEPALLPVDGPAASALALLGIRIDVEGPPDIHRLGLLDAAGPRYERVVDAALAAGPAVPIHVLCGGECAYRRPVRANPAFDGVDLAEAAFQRGCSFCPSGSFYSPKWQFASDPVDLAMSQIDAACAACAADPELAAFFSSSADRRLHFMMRGAVIVQRLEAFFERLLDRDRAPAVFLLSVRADERLGRAEIIERWLPRLAEAGHAIGVWVIGVENFSAAENARFNKNISAEQVVRSHERMSAWEDTWPTAFSFRRWGGFAVILFTPWTTLDDLAVNIECLRRIDQARESPYALRSRLQLRPGAPITLLATHDGLVTEVSDEPPWDSGCLTSWQEREVPWRFADPGTAWTYRIASRLVPTDELADDPLYQRVQRHVGSAVGLGLPCLDLFEALVAIVGESTTELDEEPILAALETWAAEASRPLAQPTEQLFADYESPDTARSFPWPSALRFLVRPVGSERTYVFGVGPATDDRQWYRRVAGVALTYAHDTNTTASEAFARVVALAMRSAPSAPTADDVPWWRAAIGRTLERAGLADRFEWTVDWTNSSGPPGDRDDDATAIDAAGH